MTLEEIVYNALRQTGIEVTQLPVVGTARKYLTWYEVTGTFERYASNAPKRVNHMITVDLYTRESPLSSEVMEILMTLRRNGIDPVSWGALDYENDTKWYHMPITCNVNRTL